MEEKKSGPMDLGVQPLETVLIERGLDNHDLVSASEVQLTHKMVARARKGRRLNRKIQLKVLAALNTCQKEKQYRLEEIFNYKGKA